MVDPTLTISIDRSAMAGALPPLVLSGSDDGTPLGVVGYVEPALQARVRYAGDSPWLHGSTAVSATWQQSMLNFDVVPDVATEAELRALVAELRAAVSQFSFLTTVTVNGATPDVWRCDMGSVVAEPRTLENLATSDPAYAVSIPVYPIAS